MAVTIQSIGLKGLEGYSVSVEVEKLKGVESMVIVGLPGIAVKESKERSCKRLAASTIICKEVRHYSFISSK